MAQARALVDIHAHFREPGNEDAETVASGQAAAAHGREVRAGADVGALVAVSVQSGGVDVQDAVHRVDPDGTWAITGDAPTASSALAVVFITT